MRIMEFTRIISGARKSVYFAVLAFAFASTSFGFETVKSGDSEYTIYGFLRNNMGMFTNTQTYTKDGNQLATARTWLRLYGDFSFNENWGARLGTQFIYEPWYTVERGNPQSENGGPQVHKRSGWKTYSEFDDVNDVLREAYMEWKPAKGNNIKFGRQIAIWGEALTDRVGDVVHPNDNRFSLAFANLEDTRIPQYMVRGIHDIDTLNSSFEWIISPLILQGQYSVNRNAQIYNPAMGISVEQRFAIHPEDSGLPGAPVQIPYGTVKEVYPDNLSDMRYGFRTSTALGGYQFGFSYFHTHNYDPLASWGATRGTMFGFPIRDLTLVHPYMDILGAYMNKQLPWPGVVRAEVTYTPNKPYSTFNIGPYENGIVRRDSLKYMVAYDLNSFLFFDWHKTAPIDVTLEHVGEWIPNSGNDLSYLGCYNTPMPNYSANFAVKVSTNWFYNRLVTDLIASYNTFGNSGTIMPSVKWQPGWLNQKFTAELKYIGVYGSSNYQGYGIFKNKDMVVLTTQFNF
jgi:hypothetical protein